MLIFFSSPLSSLRTDEVIASQRNMTIIRLGSGAHDSRQTRRFHIPKQYLTLVCWTVTMSGRTPWGCIGDSAFMTSQSQGLGLTYTCYYRSSVPGPLHCTKPYLLSLHKGKQWFWDTHTNAVNRNAIYFFVKTPSIRND